MSARDRSKVLTALIAWVLLMIGVACGRSTGVPEPSSSNTQKLPFDREPASSGISPSESAIPGGLRLPEGTSLAVRLRKPLSSASARPGDSFEGVLDDSVSADGQAALPRGATVAGRVLDAKRANGTQSPGYLRITLVGIQIGSKTLLVDTSSVFVKGRKPNDRPSATGRTPSGQDDITISTDRRLTFRLAQTLDLK